MTSIQLAAFGALAFIATPASAASVVDNYASDAIASARLTEAVALLEPRVAVAPRDESALINLAVAYRRSGRAAEADALYRRVLTLDDVVLDAADGSAINAHEVARRALASRTLASR